MKSLSLRKSLASLGAFLIMSSSVSAASLYTVSQAEATVDETVTSSIEINYTVDPTEQTWADGDTLTVQLPAAWAAWSELTFSVQYDGETAIVEGSENGTYAVDGDTLTIKWDATTWGEVVEGTTINISIADSSLPETSTFVFGGTTAAEDTEPSAEVVVEVAAEEEEEEVTVVNFSDLDDHWAKVAVEAMAGFGVVNGDPDGTFRPNDGLNRAEGAALLYRVMFGSTQPEAASEKPYSDTALDQWYTAYISALKVDELVNGNPDGTFKPEVSMNRAEFLTLAMNVYLKMNNMEMGDVAMTTAFADLDKTAWYAKTVSFAESKGFIKGSACGDYMCFAASASISRAEAATILYNIFGSMLADDDTTVELDTDVDAEVDMEGKIEEEQNGA